MVSLQNNKAVPDALTVKTGEYVQFNSKDGKSHQIASGSGSAYGNSHVHQSQGGIDSETFGPRDGYKVQFKKAGTYEFHDNLNPKIFITVVAYEAK